MRNMIDAYLNEYTDELLYYILYQDRPEWSQALFNFLTTYHELLRQDIHNFSAAAYASGLDKYPELQEILRHLEADYTHPWLRADWPFRKVEKPLQEWFGHDDFVGGLVFLRDKRLASSSEDGWIRVWERDQDEPVLEVCGHDENPINYLAYDESHHLLISAGDDFKVRLWNPDSLEEVAVLTGHENYVSVVAIAGDRVVTGSKDQTVGVWDLKEKKLIQRMAGHKDWVHALAISPDGKQAISGATNDSLILWDIENCRLVKRIIDGVNTVTIMEGLYCKLKGPNPIEYPEVAQVALWPSPDLVITGDEMVIGWDPETWTEKFRLSENPWTIKRLILSGNTLITVAHSVKAWDLGTGVEKFNISGHDGETIFSAALSKDGRYLATADEKGRIHLRDLEDLLHNDYGTGHSGGIRSMASSGENRVVTGSFDKTAAIWDLASGQVIQKLSGFPWNEVKVYCSDPVYGEVVTTCKGEIRVWNRDNGELLTQINCDNKIYEPEQMLPVAGGFITNAMGNELKFWDRESKAVSNLDAHYVYYDQLQLSRDSRFVLAATYPSNLSGDENPRKPIHSPLVLFDMKKKRIYRKFWHPAWFKSWRYSEKVRDKKKLLYPMNCVWSPDEKMVAASFSNRNVLVWNIAKRRRLVKIKPFKNANVHHLLWMDGHTLAVIAENGSDLVRIDVDRKVVSHRERISDRPIWHLAMTPDLRYWAWSGRGRRIGVYDLLEHCTLSTIEMPSDVSTLHWHGERLLVGCEAGILYSFRKEFGNGAESDELEQAGQEVVYDQCFTLGLPRELENDRENFESR